MTLYKGFIFLLTTTYVTLISTTACKNSSSMIENQARKWTQSLRYCTTSFGVDIHNGLEFKHKYLPAMLKSDLDDRSFLCILNDKITFKKKNKIFETRIFTSFIITCYPLLRHFRLTCHVDGLHTKKVRYSFNRP